MPVTDSNEDKRHVEAFDRLSDKLDGTYELVGPKVQANPENWPDHSLIMHRKAKAFENVPRTFDEIKGWMSGKDIEGIVFHHPDGRMSKIKKSDFGMKR